jgi:TatD DNase family protein
MKLIDAHTHLSSKEFDSDRPEVLSRAFDVCDYLIDIGSGTSPDAFDRARKFAEDNERVYFTAGIHPHDAEKLGQDTTTLNAIEKLLLHPKCVGVGECGLDYYYNHSAHEIQKDIFKWHIELATKYKLPLMIHTRDAEADTKTLLEHYQGPAVFHCFTGTQDLADFGAKKGFLISFSGIVTFKTAEDLRKVFLSLPLDNIIVETDSPYLAPIPMRGKRNESSFVAHTAKFLSDLRKISAEEFTEKTSRNVLRLFKKINQPERTN